MMDYNTIINDDCLHAMQGLEDNTIDSIVTDPPYGLSFMGKDWDHGIPGVVFWQEALRIAKPGCHLLAFGGTRAFHRLAVAIEDAGWDIRDTLMWVYGSGFPKSHNLKGEWQGYGTALKPAWEPVIVARKPLEGTVANNVLKWGTGAINIDGCRVGIDTIKHSQDHKSFQKWKEQDGRTHKEVENPNPTFYQGRFPANLIHDGSDEVVGGFPNVKAGVAIRHRSGGKNCHSDINKPPMDDMGYGDSGSASRFFYCAKASKSERNMGCEGLEERKRDASRHVGQPSMNGGDGNPYNRGAKPLANNHPTVKPLALMRYLCRLVTPPDGVVLDPFCGSGSTLVGALQEGFRYIGIEKDPDYVNIAYARTKHALKEWGRKSRQQVLQEVVS